MELNKSRDGGCALGLNVVHTPSLCSLVRGRKERLANDHDCSGPGRLCGSVGLMQDARFADRAWRGLQCGHSESWEHRPPPRCGSEVCRNATVGSVYANQCQQTKRRMGPVWTHSAVPPLGPTEAYQISKCTLWALCRKAPPLVVARILSRIPKRPWAWPNHIVGGAPPTCVSTPDADRVQVGDS